MRFKRKGDKMKLGVVGKDVSRSESPVMHKFIAERLGYEIEYDKISVSEDRFADEIDDLLKSYDGLNFTIPYKRSVIPYLNNVSGDAKAFGAVNTVKTADLSGHNTDGLGFMLMLYDAGAEIEGKKYLVIGAGGAGRSVAKKLADAGAEVYVYDKNADRAYAVAQEFGVLHLKEITPSNYYCIINASGIGMHKTEGTSPVGEDVIALCEVAVDLIYVPKKSEFLNIAERAGKKIINGEAMLFYQAYYAECIFAGITSDSVVAGKLFKEYSK